MSDLCVGQPLIVKVGHGPRPWGEICVFGEHTLQNIVGRTETLFPTEIRRDVVVANIIDVNSKIRFLFRKLRKLQYSKYKKRK